MLEKVVAKMKEPLVVKIASSVVGAVAGLLVAVLITGNTDSELEDIPFDLEGE